MTHLIAYVVAKLQKINQTTNYIIKNISKNSQIDPIYYAVSNTFS